MTEEHKLPDSAAYHIRLQGHLDARWAAQLEGLSMTWEADGETLLAGLLPDQAALFGVLKRVRDLGIPLISVMRVHPDGVDPTGEVKR